MEQSTKSINSVWSFVRVDEIFEIQQGKQVSQKNRVGDNQKPFLRTKNILWNRLDLTDLDTMHFKPTDERRLKLKSGDLLLCEGGSVGRTAIWQEDIEECYYQNHLHRLRVINNKCSYQFALYWFWYAFEYSSFYSGRKNITTIPNLSRSRLAELPIPLPPIEEQRKIASVLTLIQETIQEQENAIALTTELKKALMQKLFTEGINNEPQKMTEIGLIPESWEVLPLRKMFKIKHGYAFKGEYFTSEGKFILMTPGHFNEDGGFRDQQDKTKYYIGEVPNDYLLKKDDLLVAMTEQKSGLLGSSAFVPESNKYLHNQRLGLIEELDESYLDKKFLFHLFNYEYVRKEISQTATGSKVKHTSPDKILNVMVGLPNLNEQKDIIFLLDEFDIKINIIVLKKQQLQDLFSTLLHQLMTAQIRVDELDLSALEKQIKE